MGLALGLIIVLMGGYAIGRASSPDVTPVATVSTPSDSSPEAGFARDMSTHHAQAVEMGMIAAKHATNPDVRTLGEDIALTQQGQVGMMAAWLREWGLLPTGEQPPMSWMPEGTSAMKDGLMPGMASQAEMDKLRAATGRDVDVLFLKMIQKHHLGGIHMVEGIQSRSTDPEVTWLAGTMKAGQQREITVIQQLLKDVGAA
ncbi:uncharacterized protein (DUF305 family) [Allocatelliglobosispora scoriae]|uniref:Uncharacterized protein (DUF305 family) n=1 Tax=Allocatelliglobosispora scoriae TaxID=643052 RepID=A0A841BYY0_9ACTN|nr:DUF305 domain-containing protein [Allocatelliglobosispora scoriae]MBB5872012.1 uncharacterized protein (DUF305 family) [Allocatelliglobosispora scoriae]